MNNINKSTFLELCLNKEIYPDQIFEFINQWHNNDLDGRDLFQILGLNDSEYEQLMSIPWNGYQDFIDDVNEIICDAMCRKIREW